MHVLIVEDDQVLGLFLQKGLHLAGHDVELVGDGETALEMAAARRPDLMVLDLGLPKLDGTEVLAQAKARFPDVSVLVLSGRSDLEERIRCLNLGAEDCVLKPFSFHELVARCMVILRRRSQHADPMLRFGDIEVNRMTRVVRRSGREIELTAKEFALLEFMMIRRGECCTRGDLLREVWQTSSDTATNIVDVYINYLRKKLSGAGLHGSRSGPVIETVRGAGYRLSPTLGFAGTDVSDLQAVAVRQGATAGR